LFPLLSLNLKTTLFFYTLLKRERSELIRLTIAKSFSPIRDVDFIFENSPVRIVCNRNCPEIELAGLKIGPLEEGKEYELPHWIANELDRAGIARFRDDELLDNKKLDKILWKEKVQQTRQVAHLEEDFYPRLRRFLTRLKTGANSNPDKNAEYRKAVDLAHDIANVRLRKIVSLASSPEQTNQTLKDLAKEERDLYDGLFEIIDEWKNNILKGAEEP
jgi:hypothetical protein